MSNTTSPRLAADQIIDLLDPHVVKALNPSHGPSSVYYTGEPAVRIVAYLNWTKADGTRSTRTRLTEIHIWEDKIPGRFTVLVTYRRAGKVRRTAHERYLDAYDVNNFLDGLR